MVSPAWFFSSLSQASAAIVGFIIAISTVHYSIERSKREDRTQKLQESLIDFRQEFSTVLSNLFYAFEEAAPDEYQERFDELEPGVDEAKRRIQNQESKVITVHAHLAVLSYSIGKIGPNLEVSEMRRIVEDIENSIQALKTDYFTRPNSLNRDLYKELTGLTDEEVPEEYLLEQNIFNVNRRAEIMNWLNENQQNGIVNPHGNPLFIPSITGKELHLIRVVMNELKLGFGGVQVNKHRTLLDYKPLISQVMRLSIVLLLVGVAIPLLFLVTLPQKLIQNPLPQTLVFTFEISLLLFTGLVLVPLIEIPLKRMDPGSGSGLSVVSRYLLNLVNRW